MAAGRSSFTKRQKEQSRMQKRQEKAERKRQRAAEAAGRGVSGVGAHDDFQINDDGQLEHAPGVPIEPSEPCEDSNQ